MEIDSLLGDDPPVLRGNDRDVSLKHSPPSSQSDTDHSYGAPPEAATGITETLDYKDIKDFLNSDQCKDLFAQITKDNNEISEKCKELTSQIANLNSSLVKFLTKSIEMNESIKVELAKLKIDSDIANHTKLDNIQTTLFGFQEWAEQKIQEFQIESKRPTKRRPRGRPKKD